MDNDRWPAFLGGLLLGVLVTLGLVGTFGWHKYQQARAEAAVQAEEAMMQAERSRELEMRARMLAEQAHRAEAEARRHAELAHEAVRKQVDEMLRTVDDKDSKDLADVRAKLRDAAKKFEELVDPNMRQ